MRATALGLGIVLAFGSAGCWATNPVERGDFGMTEVAVFAANDGPFCVAAIDLDDVESEVLLLDYMNGVHHYTLDGVYVETTVNEIEAWNAVNAHGLAFMGGSEAVVVSEAGDAFRMELEGGALAAFDMGGLTLGHALGYDDLRGTLLAVPAEAEPTWGEDAVSTLLVLDGANAAPIAELPVAVGLVKGVTYMPDRDALLVLGTGGEVLMVDPETGATVAQGFGPQGAFSIAYDATSGRVLLARWGLTYYIHTFEIDWY